MTTARALEALPVALDLVGAVRRWDRRDVAHILSSADLPAVAVALALAAMVDDDRTLTDLIAWTEQHDGELFEGWQWHEILAAHAQHEQCRVRSVTPPDDVREGERLYQRARYQRRRARAAAS